MKLRRTEVDHIARQIVNQLLAGDYMEAKDVAVTTAQVAEAIRDDLMIEDCLNDEVRQILAKHAEEVQRGRVEYHQAFNLIKARLIKERNLII